MSNTDVQRFIDVTLGHYDATTRCEVDRANAFAGDMSRIAARLLGDSSTADTFLELLTHEKPLVRLTVAAFGLQRDEQRCRAVLEEIASGEDSLAFEAKQCLRRWEEGDWHLDEVPNESGRILHERARERSGDSTGLPVLQRKVPYEAVVDEDGMDHRIGIVNISFVNLIGVNADHLSFCPNSEPPVNDEVLAWTWVVRPDLVEKILPLIENEQFRANVATASNFGRC